jgi:hypothetical protein
MARVRIMVLNATFNNISVISWRSVLLEEETGRPGENQFNGKTMTQIGLGNLVYFDPLSYSRKDNDDDI